MKKSHCAGRRAPLRRAALLSLPPLFLLTSCFEPKLADELQQENQTTEPAEAEAVIEADSAVAGQAAPSVEPKSNAVASLKEKPTIPAPVTVENASGQSLKGTLLAKSGTEFVLRRESDSKLFLLGVEGLSSESRQVILEFPDAEVAKLNQFKSATVASAATTGSAPRRAPIGGGYSDDYEKALKESETSGRALMVIFLGDADGSTGDDAGSSPMTSATVTSSGSSGSS